MKMIKQRALLIEFTAIGPHHIDPCMQPFKAPAFAQKVFYVIFNFKHCIVAD